VTVDWEEIDLILEKIHKLVGTEYNRNQFVNEVVLTNQTLSFSQLLDLLEERQHLANVDTVIANGAILELYEENILEVLKKVVSFVYYFSALLFFFISLVTGGNN